MITILSSDSMNLPSPTIKISADYREKDIIGQLKFLGADVIEGPLEVGDFIASDRVVIERKTCSDFMSSIFDGRVFEQVINMKANFEVVVLILEGTPDSRMRENIFKAAVSSLIVKFNISLINTRDQEDTAKMIYHLARKEQIESKRSFSYKTEKIPMKISEIKERIVASIPDVNVVISKRLLEKFGSVERVFTASEVELKEVDGIGKIMSAHIRKILSEKY